MENTWLKDRDKIVGLSENSFRKSYYPELQEKIDELEASQRNLDTIINNTSDSIIIHDITGKIIFLNKSAQLLLNIKQDDISKITLRDISAPQNDFNSLLVVWESVIDNNPQTIEWSILKQGTDEVIPVEVSINNSHWNGEHVFVSVLRDFTFRKKYEEELLKAKDKAEKSSYLKTGFLQKMSHEFRTPLNAIIGFSNLLNQQERTAEERGLFTSIIIDNSNHLFSIIDNILTILSLQTKEESIQIKPVNINQILAELYSIHHGSTLAKNLELKLHKPLTDTESIVLTDKDKITKIFNILLSYSLENTLVGGIEFGYELINENLVFFVKDTGSGTPIELQSNIFNRKESQNPYQLESLKDNLLGLIVAKEFVELLDGELWIESDSGKGSIIFFKFHYLPTSE